MTFFLLRNIKENTLKNVAYVLVPIEQHSSKYKISFLGKLKLIIWFFVNEQVLDVSLLVLVCLGSLKNQ